MGGSQASSTGAGQASGIAWAPSATSSAGATLGGEAQFLGGASACAALAAAALAARAGARVAPRSRRGGRAGRAARVVRHGLVPGKSPADRIRNFSIIAHIDHGKSTLADRMLEETGTVSKEDMQNQVLDNMDIERERGITIKLMTARMNVQSPAGDDYVLNLIDTPGHVDFTYEVSRSLAACEGALLVVDATQGVEAQTLANVTLAMENDLEIIPVLNKIDLATADPDRVSEEIEDILGIDCSEALHCSAKTGLGVRGILDAVINKIPAPTVADEAPLRCLIFDSFYDNYRGVIAMFRVVDGVVKKGMNIRFMASGKEFPVDELGVMVGGLRKPVDALATGEVGYLCASIKSVADARVGDTICQAGCQTQVEALPGYTNATPMVFCGLFPSDSGMYDALKQAFERLSLNDAAITYEPENSAALGLGFRCGFLGILHMEVIKERLEREYGMDLTVTAPSVAYEVKLKSGETVPIEFANQLPEVQYIAAIKEPYVLLEMIVPEEHIGACMDLSTQRRAIYRSTNFMSRNRVLLQYEMPMAEMIRDFFSELKARSRGYASMDYRILEHRPNDLVKLEVDINKTTAHPLAQIVHRSRALELGKKMVEILKDEIPAQQIVVIIQARIGTHIMASQRIKAIRKDVLAKCYGGDVSRKKKLLQKQAAGKKKMQAIGRVSVPSEAILAVIKKT